MGSKNQTKFGWYNICKEKAGQWFFDCVSYRENRVSWRCHLDILTTLLGKSELQKVRNDFVFVLCFPHSRIYDEVSQWNEGLAIFMRLWLYSLLSSHNHVCIIYIPTTSIRLIPTEDIDRGTTNLDNSFWKEKRHVTSKDALCSNMLLFQLRTREFQVGDFPLSVY